MPSSREINPPDAQLAAWLARPRFLRVIPSLVVLTTALAWGAFSPIGELGLDGGVRAGVTLDTAAGGKAGAGFSSVRREAEGG